METVEIKKLLEEFSPDLFITVHSGAKGLFTPYAYKKATATRYHEIMIDVLGEIDKKYCNCKVGPAAEVLGYASTGNCLDYAYDKTKAPFAYAFEIFEEKSSFRSFLQKPYSCFIQKSDHMTSSECFTFFNPKTEAEYNKTIENWTSVLKDTIVRVNEVL